MEIVSIGEIIGVVLVVCEVIKRAGLQSKYVPLLAIVLGVASSFFFGGIGWENTLIGVVLGLGTTLGYREVKKVTE